MPEANSTESNQSVTQSAAGEAESNQGTSADNQTQQNAPVIQQQPQQQHSQQRPANPGPNFGEVLTAIQAMPEQIIRALREAAPQQPKQNSSESSNQETRNTSGERRSGESQQNSTRSPGKKTFAEWWFGG